MSATNLKWKKESVLALGAAQQAYQHIAKAKSFDVSYKGRVDLVTQIDVQSETETT